MDQPKESVKRMERGLEKCRTAKVNGSNLKGIYFKSFAISIVSTITLQRAVALVPGNMSKFTAISVSLLCISQFKGCLLRAVSGIGKSLAKTSKSFPLCMTHRKMPTYFTTTKCLS